MTHLEIAMESSSLTIYQPWRSKNDNGGLHLWSLNLTENLTENLTSSSVKDSMTSLSLSLPGVENEAVTVAATLPPPVPLHTMSLRQIQVENHQNLNLNNNSNNADVMTSIPMAISTAMRQLKVLRDPVPSAAPAAAVEQPEKVLTPFSAEFLSVMQEMIRTEVKNYMTGVEQHNNQQRSGDRGGGMCMKHAASGGGDGFRNAAVVKRIGISKID
ncbi:transcription factor MYB73-like [Helianthus annuus]|nr:transcription factor MYB73-like [Helianthus annuus]